jgi:putative copper export protein/methionine-rich copper-binding protein CopC
VPAQRLLVLLLALGAWLFIAAAPALAHAELESSEPAEGAVLTTPPRQLTLTFTEDVSARDSAVRVGADHLPLSRPHGKPDVLVADASRLRLSGDVVVSWRSVSEDDGHAESGVIHFRVGPSATPAATPAATSAATSAVRPTTGSAVRNVSIAVRLIGYLGMALLVGGLAFVALVWPAGMWDRRTRRLLVVAWTAGTAATVAGIGLAGAYAAQLPLRAAVRPEVMGQPLASHAGEVWAAKGLLWLLAGVVLAWACRDGDRAVGSAAWRFAAAAVGAGLLRTTGMTAHAAETAHAGWSELADLLHLSGVSLWFGGLAALLVGVLPRRHPAELAEVVPRFSRFALTAVLVIASSGLVLAWQLVGGLSGLLHTSYGRLLLVKVAVFVLVLAAAQRSKAWVATRLCADGATVRPFLYSVTAETALLVAVLTAATLLVTAAPGR